MEYSHLDVLLRLNMASLSDVTILFAELFHLFKSIV